MDLKLFFQKVRETEESLKQDFVVTISLDTPDGGKAGVFTEVNKRIAARAIVEGKARLATEKETAAYRTEVLESARAQEEQALAGQVRLSVIPESELKALRSSIKQVK
jgi:hypothetical protein